MGTSSFERRDAYFAKVLFVRTTIAIKTAAKEIIPFGTLIAEIDCFSIFISTLSFEQVMYNSILACWSAYKQGKYVRPGV